MDRNKVFIGYHYKNIKRCLLYQNTNHSYIDLETRQSYYDFEILESPRISYNKLLELTGYSSRREIKKRFQEEENRMIPLSNIFVGDVYQVTNILNRSYFGTNLLNFGVNTEFTAEPVFFNRLVERDKFLTYTDLYTNEKYNDGFGIEIGNFYISDEKFGHDPHLKTFNKVFNVGKTELTKKKVLEIYQSKYNIQDTYRTI